MPHLGMAREGLFCLKGTCAQFTNRGGVKTAEKPSRVGKGLLSNASRSHTLYLKVGYARFPEKTKKHKTM